MGHISFAENTYNYTFCMDINHKHLHGNQKDLVSPGKPILILLCDQNSPELIDEGIHMVIILIILDANLDNHKDIIISAFKIKSCCNKQDVLIQPGSLILVCLSELLFLLVQTTLTCSLSILRVGSWTPGVNIDLEPMPDNSSVIRLGLVVIPVTPPTTNPTRSKCLAL